MLASLLALRRKGSFMSQFQADPPREDQCLILVIIWLTLESVQAVPVKNRHPLVLHVGIIGQPRGEKAAARMQYVKSASGKAKWCRKYYAKHRGCICASTRSRCVLSGCNLLWGPCSAAWDQEYLPALKTQKAPN